MTFKGAFQSFQTVLIPCAHLGGGESQTYLTCCSCTSAPVGYRGWQLRCSPPQGISCLCSLFPSHPSLPLQEPGSSCSAGCPFQGKFFLVGFGSCWDCVFRKQHLLPPPVIFPLEEPRQRRGRGSGGRDSPSSAGNSQPWLREGTASACSSSESLQALGSCGTGALGVLWLPCPSRSEEIPSSGSCSQAAAADSPPCSPFPGPSLPPQPALEHPRAWGCCPGPVPGARAALGQDFPRVLGILLWLMLGWLPWVHPV